LGLLSFADGTSQIRLSPYRLAWQRMGGGYLRRPHCSPCIRPQHIDQTRTPVGDNSILGNESKVGILRYKAATALTPGSVGYLG
jgi:hypothetical protein